MAAKPAKLFIDVGNAGAGVYDQLKHMVRPIRPGLSLRHRGPAGAGEEGGHAPARRLEPGPMGCGCLDVRAAGGAEQFQS